MVRVIREPVAALPYEFDCPKCRARLEASPGEGKKHCGDGYLQDGDYVVFECPRCRCERYVSVSVLKQKGWLL